MSILLTPIYGHTDVLGAAMQAAVIRNKVINHNIANQNTPGFKRKEVVFGTTLAEEIEKTNFHEKGQGVFVDGKNLQAKIVTDRKSFSYRLDENNVDIETEMVELYENMTRYDVLVDSVMNTYQRVNIVFNTMK